MTIDWVNVLDRLRACPPRVNRLLPRCPEARIVAVEADLGKIPEGAADLFQQPVPIGPYSAWKYFGGVQYAPAGSLDTINGIFTPTSALIGPRTLIYGPDVLLYGGAATAGGLYLYGSRGGH